MIIETTRREIMTPYDATYKKQFDGVNPFTHKPTMITAREKLAKMIDGSWRHSWHWPEDHNQWLEAARISLESEIDIATRRLEQLNGAKGLLFSIDKEDTL